MFVCRLTEDLFIPNSQNDITYHNADADCSLNLYLPIPNTGKKFSVLLLGDHPIVIHTNYDHVFFIGKIARQLTILPAPGLRVDLEALLNGWLVHVHTPCDPHLHFEEKSCPDTHTTN